MVRTHMTLRSTPEISLKDQLTAFVNKLSILLGMTSQYANDTECFGFHLNGIAKDGNSKASFILLSIGYESMENIIDNSETTENLSYGDTYTNLTDIVARREGVTDIEVFTANRTPPLNNNNKICMYFKERDMKYEVHFAK